MRRCGSTPSNTPAGWRLLELDRLAALRQHAHGQGSRAERAHDDAAVDRVGPEHAVRVGMLARDEALELLRERHARAPGARHPAGSVRKRERDGIGIVNLPRSSGILLHVTSLPGGRLGPPAYAFVDWLAAAGQSWWQILPLARPTAPARRTPRPRRSRPGRACWPSPRRRSATPSSPPSARAHAYWIDDWERFAGPGAVEDQVRFEREWSALRRYAIARGVRLIGDIPLYVGPRSADHRSHPELFQRGCRGGRPAGRAERDRAAVGQSALRLGGAAAQRLSLVDRAPAARRRPGRPRPHRPLPRLRRVLVGARARAQRARRALAARARGGGLRRRPRASSARSR